MSSMYRREIHQFVKFFTVKRDIYTSEVEAIFRDFKDERLAEEMYSKDETDKLMEDLLGLIKARVSKDLGTTAEMAALVLEQVMAGAEEAGVALAVDLSRTEDSVALERVRSLDAVQLNDMPRRGGTGGRLESLRDEHARLVAERERLGEEAAALRERSTQLQSQCSTLVREKSEVESRLRAAEAEASSIRSGAGSAAASSAAASAASASLREQVEDLSAALERVRTELATITKERDARLADSKQFAQLRALLARKNAQMVDLKARLAKHEPATHTDEEEEDD